MGQRERLQFALGDRYKIESVLGRGGMATVYLAADLKLGRQVAIKVLDPDIASAVGLDRFLREIEIAERLQHPFILPLFDSGGSEEILYYVMPYVEGESLRQRLDREGPLPVMEAVRIAREVADALDFAHSHGVIHRDIKPENILLEGGHAVVADFGIARAVSEASDERLTTSGHAVGTPAYMSPEQASGEGQLDGRSDIYSLSCVLYEMLTGRPPYSGNLQAVISGHMLEPPPSVTDSAPDVPAPIASTVQRGLSKIPADRFHSPTEFSTALELPVAAPGVRRYRSVGARWVAGVTALAILAVAAVVTFEVVGGQPLDRDRVLVFPLMGHDGQSSLAGDGRTAAIAIEIALDQTDPLKWVDGWDRLPETVRRDPVLFTADLARSIAMDRRAGYYIDGVLTTEGDSISVLLKLHDVESDAVIESAASSGPADAATVGALALKAVVRLLPGLVDPGRESVVPALAGRDPAAIALCIQGEREYRLAHFADALDRYERALSQDSLLALAAMKGALAAAWEHEDDKGKTLIGIAVSRDTLLSPRYAHLARCIRAYFSGEADLAVQQCRGALEYDSRWTEALTWLAEVYYHLLPSEPRLDSLAATYFRRVAELDTGFVPPLVHLAEIALVNDEPQRAAAAIQRLKAVAGIEGTAVRRLTIMLDCVREGPDEIAWEAKAAEFPTTVLTAAMELASAGANPVCAERGFQAVLSDQKATLGHKWGAALGLQGLWIAQGRYGEALALLDSLEASGISRVHLLYILDYLGGAPFEARASSAAAYARELFGSHYERASSETQWMMGAWHARSREASQVAVITRSVEALAQESGDRRDRLLADALAGHLALVRGDTGEAITRFEDLKPSATRDSLLWQFPEALAVEKLLLADLLLRRGQYRRAHDVATIFDHSQPVIYRAYLARSLAIRLAAARAMRDDLLVNRYRRRLEELGRSDLLRSNM